MELTIDEARAAAHGDVYFTRFGRAITVDAVYNDGGYPLIIDMDGEAWAYTELYRYRTGEATT